MSVTIQIYEAMLKAVQDGRPAVVATVLKHKGSSPGKEFHKLIAFEDGSFEGTVGGGKMEAEVLKHCAKALEKGQGEVVEILLAEEELGGVGSVCGGYAQVALELLPRIPRILLCGGGHCSVELARLIHQMGYTYEVHEDRPELVGKERFPMALNIHVGAPEGLAGLLGDISRFSHVLLVSRGFATDRVYGRMLFEAGYEGWVGMLASKRKEKKVRKEWVENDGLSQEWVDRVEAPMGIKIGARSPAEIAVSITARIIETLRS
jgi:xanthine dehydrogenase accessory factor